MCIKMHKMYFKLIEFLMNPLMQFHTLFLIAIDGNE